MLLSALLITLVLAKLGLSDRQRRYLYDDTAGDGLPHRCLVYLYAGFFDELFPSSLSIRARRADILVRRFALAGADAMAAELNEVYWTGHWILVVWPPMVALAIALLVFSLREPTWEWQWLGSQALVWLGHVSFGIYLWHFQVMRALVLLWPELWSTPSMSLLALSLACPRHWRWPHSVITA